MSSKDEDVKVEPALEVAPTSTRLVSLVSKLNYTVHVAYGDDSISISPHGSAQSLDPALLPLQLPQGILKIDLGA